MKPIKKIALVFVIVFVAIQFIQPAYNKSGKALPTDFVKYYNVPADIENILQNACYDCHSNNTNYTWYSNFQPMAWIMANHINRGKEKLNFSRFGSNTTRKQISKLKEMTNESKADEMPLASYKMIHKKAMFSKEQKSLIMDWINETADNLSEIN